MMPSYWKMKEFAKANEETVWLYQTTLPMLITQHADVKQAVESMPDFFNGKVRTYAILLAMGFGDRSIREKVIPGVVARRLES
jgi:hypothetical protein